MAKRAVTGDQQMERETPKFFLIPHKCSTPVPVATRSAAACLLRLRVRIPPGTCTSVCSNRCVLSGRGLCDELITRPEESYRLWCVAVCDLETSWIRRPWPTAGLSRQRKKISVLCVRPLQHGRRQGGHPFPISEMATMIRPRFVTGIC